MQHDTLLNMLSRHLELPPKDGDKMARLQKVIDLLNATGVDFSGVLAPKKKPRPVSFYESREWRELRYKALRLNDGRCELCGASKHSGAALHVDHIMPRSKFPTLELEETNLQVLCADCNMGKSNQDTTDWRRSAHDVRK
jgi:HNH endonuclease